MSYITGNIQPLEVWVKGEYLYSDYENKSYDLVRAKLLTVRCLTGQVPLFKVLLENGVMRDKLPCSAFLMNNERPDVELPFHVLCLWNSFSNRFTVYTINHLYNSNIKVKLKTGELVNAKYMFSIDWASNDFDNDLTESESEKEHKEHHFAWLTDDKYYGQIVAQPNNRTLWSEPSFVTKKYEGEQYKVNTEYWDAEQFDKWITEDSDNYMYETNDNNS